MARREGNAAATWFNKAVRVDIAIGESLGRKNELSRDKDDDGFKEEMILSSRWFFF